MEVSSLDGMKKAWPTKLASGVRFDLFLDSSYIFYFIMVLSSQGGSGMGLPKTIKPPEYLCNRGRTPLNSAKTVTISIQTIHTREIVLHESIVMMKDFLSFERMFKKIYHIFGK